MGLLGVAAAIRAFAWSRTTVVFNDGPIFLAMAEAIAEGRWSEVLAHPFHPLYPALIALAARLPIALETAGVLVSVLGGLLSIVGIFLFVRSAFGRDVAWLSAWTVALHPWAVDFSSDVMSDGVYAGFYLVGFAALFSALDRPRARTGFLCGAAAGLAYLVRPEGLGLAIAACLLWPIVWALRPSGAGGIGRVAAAVVLGVALLAAPLVAVISDQTGEFGLTRKKSIPALASGRADGVRNEAVGEVVSALPLPRSAERVDGPGPRKPPRSLGGFLEAITRVFRTSLASLRYEIAAFALVGLWGLRGRWRVTRESAVAVSAVLYSGLLVLLVWGAGYVARRHALAALLPIVGYAAVGWRTIVDACVRRVVSSRSRPGRSSSVVVTIALLVTLSIVWGPRDLRARRVDREPVRLAAEWLAAQARGSNPRVAAQKLRVAYYAGGAFFPLPSGNDAPLSETLQESGVGWLVIDDRRLDDHRGLREGIGDWLAPVHLAESDHGRAWVFEVKPRSGI